LPSFAQRTRESVKTHLNRTLLPNSQSFKPLPKVLLKQLTIFSGLGIGTSPSALNAHGINTTAIEIDPVVSHFATTYFDLPPGVTVVNEDVTIYINRTLSSTTRYDHIIHDVFTGGAEPLELFTYEFLLGLKDLLNPKGTIAIVSF